MAISIREDGGQEDGEEEGGSQESSVHLVTERSELRDLVWSTFIQERHSAGSPHHHRNPVLSSRPLFQLKN